MVPAPGAYDVPDISKVLHIIQGHIRLIVHLTYITLGNEKTVAIVFLIGSNAHKR